MPVALNLYEIKKAKGPGGDFFRAVQKQRPGQYQGLYLVDPETARQAHSAGVGRRNQLFRIGPGAVFEPCAK